MEILDWAGWIVALLATIFAIRASIHFDLNAWLKDRREQKEEELRSHCLHIYLTRERGGHKVHSTFISPSVTTAWQCQQCGKVTHDEQSIDDAIDYWVKNPTALARRAKQIDKLARKLGRTT